MSSISLSLKMMLAATACAGLVAACGDDSGGGDTKPATKDGGSKDAGKDAGRRDASVVPHTNPGDDCTGLGGMCDDDQCDSPPCYSQCVDGVSADCVSQSDIIGSLADGGLNNFLRDASIQIPGLGDAGISKTDGGVQVTIGDAAVVIPGMACPSSLECSSGSSGFIQGLIAQLSGGIPYCSDPSGLPPACQTTKDCTDMGFKAAMCLDTMVVGKFCLQVCN